MASFLKNLFNTKKVDLVSSTSRRDYLAQREARKALYEEREKLVADLAKQIGDTFDGYCAVCEKTVAFRVAKDPKNGTPWWRESFDCPECQYCARMRALIHLYYPELKGNATKCLYITEQITPLYRWLKERLQDVVGSEWLGADVKPGEIRADGVRHEDFTNLSFDSNSIDYVLSFECLEHIPDYKAALREAFRVLKPGGKMIMSAPFIRNLEKTLVRAEISASGEIIHHEPPDYHGNPLDPQGSLCFYYFSFDLLDEIRAVGFKDVEVTEYWSKDYAYLGTVNLTYITAIKPNV